MTESIEKRQDWVDVLKALGMFAIILGHFNNFAGYSYLYVFTYHVPLFFFAAGFFAIPRNDVSIREYVIEKIKKIIIPYLIFSALAIFIIALEQNLSPRPILVMVKQSLIGIRNHMPAGGLWFLTCLFTVSITYYVFFKIFKKKIIILIISIVLYVFFNSKAMLFLFPNFVYPSWFFNVDSMLLYLLTYALGDTLFQPIKKEISSCENSKSKRKIHIFIFLFLCIISAYVFFYAKLPIIPNTQKFLLNKIKTQIIQFVGIFLNIYVSVWISKKDIKILRPILNIGKNSLFYCGNELISKKILGYTISLFGLSLNIASPLQAYIYSGVVMATIYIVLVPIESAIFYPYLKDKSIKK